MPRTKPVELTDEQITDIVKKKRGSKSPSVEANTTATREDIKEITTNVLFWYGRKCVKTDEECAELYKRNLSRWSYRNAVYAYGTF